MREERKSPSFDVPCVANQPIPTSVALILPKFESLLLRHTKLLRINCTVRTIQLASSFNAKNEKE